MEQVNKYHVIPKHDEQHEEIFYLVSGMSKCQDFANVVTQLQEMGKQMGLQVLTTPKYHAELAGEGI